LIRDVPFLARVGFYVGGVGVSEFGSQERGAELVLLLLLVLVGAELVLLVPLVLFGSRRWRFAAQAAFGGPFCCAEVA
jgi:hypothetical protein